MNFDEFLLSKETSFNTKKNTIIKVKYNENIDIIYKSNKKLNYMSNLSCIGYWENKTQKLYGDDFEFCTCLNSNFYQESILQIKDDIIRDCNILLDKYIKENLSTLKEQGHFIFKKYKMELNENQLIHSYIYDNDITEIDLKININYFDLELIDKQFDYVQAPQKTVEKIFNDYINKESEYWGDIKLTKPEYIGIKLAINDLEVDKLNEIKKNPDSISLKKHNIIQAIKDVGTNVTTLTLTVKHNGTLVEFKYPYSKIYDFYFRTPYIKDLEAKNTMENLYAANQIYHDDFEFDIADIVSISYRKQTLYNDISLSKKISDIDITDDLFG